MSTSQTLEPSLILVEDNETLRDELALYLSDEGFAVRGVDCGEELDAILCTQATDILILDLNLPDEDGLDITRRIRASMPDLGIIILSARVRSIDRLEGYAAGADVYLTKPTRPEELTAVVRNLFGRLKPKVRAMHWQLDSAGATLHCPDGFCLRLTGNEALLLRELALSGPYASHAKLLVLFGDENQSEKINKARIEVLISRLRQKLAPHVGADTPINALRGRGYQLGFPMTVKNIGTAI